MFRKALLIFICIFSLSVSPSEAQSVFKRGDVGINAGIGLGWQYKANNNRVNALAPVPSVNGSVEIGVYEIPGAGVISVGGILAFRKTWDDGRVAGIDYEYTYYNTFIAGRAVFHLGFFDSKGFDVYTGMHTGIRLWRDNYVDPFNDITDTGSKFVHDFFLGSRYLLSGKVGIFAELGYRISYFRTGLCLII